VSFVADALDFITKAAVAAGAFWAWRSAREARAAKEQGVQNSAQLAVVHDKVDGQMEEQKALIRQVGEAVGHRQGVADQKAENAAEGARRKDDNP
jgi:hypothetical protein